MFAPPAEAILRLFSWISLECLDDISPVGNVTRLIIRRQLRRRFPPGFFLRLLHKLPALEHLVYEPWRPWQDRAKDLQDGCKQALYNPSVAPFTRSIPNLWLLGFLAYVKQLLNTLKTVSIFEDFSECLAKVLVESETQRWNHPPMHVKAVRVADLRIGAAFAARSLDLEQLSVAYMVNAEDFFDACLLSWTWPRLESLALTSHLLHEWRHREGVEALLYQAGMTALRMPRLRALAIWSSRGDAACAFTYHTDPDYAYVTWRGTWEMDLSPRVIEVWERVAVALEGCSRRLRVTKQSVEGVIRCHGDGIHHLALPCPVVAPESLWQIRREEDT